MKYGIGLDVGIASCGFAVMLLDEKDRPYKIYKLNSRVFDIPEIPKTGGSVAAERRAKRSIRRVIRRHQHRNQRIRFMIVKNGILSQDILDSLFDKPVSDIYQLRTEALDRKVTAEEFARILINLSQRRGFKSNRKEDGGKESDDGKMLTAVSENRERMEKNGYRTVGEMFFKDEIYAEHKRNKASAAEKKEKKASDGKINVTGYISTVGRDMVEEEIHLIFDAQRRYGNSFASEQNEKEYCDVVLSQRPFDIGPGKAPYGFDSPYGGNLIEKMIGHCTFFPEEPRIAKAAYTFQKFELWQKINNIRVESHSEKRPLTDEERHIIYQLAHKNKSVNYASIRKEIGLCDEYIFCGIKYENLDEKKKSETKAKFDYLKKYHEIKSKLDEFEKGCADKFSNDDLDEIGRILTVFKSEDNIRNELKKTSIDEKYHEAILSLPSETKTGNLSQKACRMILPYLEKGFTYDKACKEAGIDFHGHGGKEKSKFLDPNYEELDDITNPAVRRSISQTIKVINAIIREMGSSPTYVNIELARELAKTKTERNDIEKEIEKNTKANEEIIKEIKENSNVSYPSGQDIVKMKLYHEQNGICPYSGETLDYGKLFKSGYAEVDHIKPYSKSFDDSYANKVLVLTAENRAKGNRLPLEYLTGEKRDRFIVWVNSQKFKTAKKNNLLKEHLTEEDEKELKARNLVDTQYLSRFLYNFINDTLLFEDFANGGKKHVNSIKGQATAYLRKRWNVAKIRENGDLHHAVDAAVIACATDELLQRVTQYSKYKEVRYSDNSVLPTVTDENGVVLDTFPFPYKEFRSELEARTSDNPARLVKDLKLTSYTAEEAASLTRCIVSRAPNRKITGSAHKDTISSGRYEGYKITKTPLSKLNKANFENYYNKESDTLLYQAIKERLEKFNYDGEKAFAKEFHKPKSDGTDGPVVKSVKLIEKQSTVPVRKNGGRFTGVAEAESMVRVDVYHIENDGYYFIPIYVSDTVKDILPTKACVANKNHDEWKEMKDEDFLFSLYHNDMIRIVSNKEINLTPAVKGSTLEVKETKEEFVYFTGADRSTAVFSFKTNDSGYKGRTGIKTLVLLEKYEIDVLGNISKVKSEKRMDFKGKKKTNNKKKV